MSWPIVSRMTGGRTEEHHLDFYPIATSEVEDAIRAAETACQLAIQQISREVEVSQALLIYPEVEDGAVEITERDMDELLPERYLGNNIVDFYMRYLERRLLPEHGKRFYFFGSRFFTKLLQSTIATRINPFKVDYEQLRRWTKEVNLFEKDYVFIPIVDSSHWSLVIICNLSSLTRAPDEKTRFPCIVHLDPIEGQHGSFEGLIRSYVLEAWMDKFEPSMDRDQLQALYQMKYIQAEVPRQDNSHDCGLYVLHYIEAFLAESTSLEFSFASSARGPHFTRPRFTMEVSAKRSYIENLIRELIDISQERDRKRKHLIQELMQTPQKLWACLEDEGNSETCVKDVQIAGPILSNGQSYENMYASTHEDALIAQHRQSTLMSRGDNEPLDGPQLGHSEYEDRNESLSPKQQHPGLEVQTVGPTHFNGPSSEAKHASTHENAVDVQFQRSSRISRLECEPLDGAEFRHGEYQRVTESSSDMLRHPEPEEIPCPDMSEALRGKNKGRRIMTEEETWLLLSCKLEGGRFCKGSRGGTHWNLISEEIGKRLGSVPSADQCRLRYDTLLKAYKTYKKYCMKTGKTFSAITAEERRDWKLATTLSEDWYTRMDEICDKANISPKRQKLSSNVCNGLHPLSSPAPSPPPISQDRLYWTVRVEHLRLHFAMLSQRACSVALLRTCNLHYSSGPRVLIFVLAVGSEEQRSFLFGSSMPQAINRARPWTEGDSELCFDALEARCRECGDYRF